MGNTVGFVIIGYGSGGQTDVSSAITIAGSAASDARVRLMRELAFGRHGYFGKLMFLFEPAYFGYSLEYIKRYVWETYVHYVVRPEHMPSRPFGLTAGEQDLGHQPDVFMGPLASTPGGRLLISRFATGRGNVTYTREHMAQAIELLGEQPLSWSQAFVAWTVAFARGMNKYVNVLVLTALLLSMLGLIVLCQYDQPRRRAMSARTTEVLRFCDGADTSWLVQRTSVPETRGRRAARMAWGRVLEEESVPVPQRGVDVPDTTPRNS